ncbi:MAG: hypothetical protein NT040_19820 [Bacteroidetes bacterium]|nr:hypothetical protein [Bacteroidota bacterium]
MIIIFNDEHTRVKAATALSNGILKNPVFFKAISDHPSFDLSTASPQIIADLMAKSDLEFKIEIFYPNVLQSIKYRKTFAFTDGRFPNTLFLNFKKLERETEDIAATIIHESIHALDDAAENETFGHGNNSAVGKENTAPYWIGNLAYRMLKNNPDAPLLAFDQVEDDNEV